MKFTSYLVPVFASLLASVVSADDCLTDDKANAIIGNFFSVYEGGLDGIDNFVTDNIQVIYPIGNHNSLNPVATGKDQFRKLVSGITDGTATRFTNPKLTNVFSFHDHENIGVYVRSDFTLTSVGPSAPSPNTVNTVGPANSQQSFFGMHFLSVDCSSNGLVNTIRSFDDEIHFLGLQGVDPITLF